MKKTFLMVVICVLATVSAFAVEKPKGIHFGTAKDTTDYIIPAPRANWYFGFGGGINALIGDEVEKSARYTGITPTAYLEFGKWVLPDVAVGFNLTGFQLKGQSRYTLQPNIDVPVGYTMTSTVNDLLPDYKEFTELGFAANGRVALDWTNFLLGFDRGMTKKWHFITPIGFGVAYERGALNNEHRKSKGDGYHGNFEFNATAGIENEFRLGENFSLINNINFLVTRGSFDFTGGGPSYEGVKSPSFDMIPSITLGARFSVPGREASRSKDGYAAEELGPNRFFANTNGLRDEIAGLEAENDQLKRDLDELQGIIDDLKNRPAEQVIKYVETDNGPDPIIVYFKIDHWDLLPEAKALLNSYAAVIKDSKEGEKFYLIGGADSATGTPKRNVLLSNNRSRVVYDYLIKKCGVNPDKLIKRALGGILEYQPIEMNRMTIVASENSRLAKIIDKYDNQTDKDK
ncbi:MAG: OmpA family protein [Bacteroidaceae bacterium]|nr:OmpA family protein [Bacteroidaceae bacterium]